MKLLFHEKILLEITKPSMKNSDSSSNIQGDSKLLSGFPWPIIFKPEKQNKTAYGI